MVSVIDLKPNRDLLDPRFETYRLESEPLGITETKLQGQVSCAEISSGQFGLCHVQLQLKRNALISDDFNPGLVFYTSQGQLRRLTEEQVSSPTGHGPRADSTLHQFPKSSRTASVRFVSDNHAVVLEPRGTLLLLSTGPRSTTEKGVMMREFEEIFSIETGLENAVALDAVEFTLADDKTVLHLLICSVKDDEAKKRGASCLDWLLLEGYSSGAAGTKDWKVARRDQLYGKAVPKFTKFLYNESGLESLRLLICADCRYQPDGSSDEPKKLVEESGKSAPLYTYVQDETEATVTFSLESGASKNDIKFTIRPHKIEVKIKDVTVIDSRLHDNVDPEASVWCTVDSKLEITLIKRNEARWPRLLINDDRGEKIFDPAYAAEVHSRLQQVFSATCKGVERVACSDMTGREHIMDMWTADGPQLVLRHDVDGLVWKFFVADDAFVRAEHLHTVSAFGYVVASKRDKVLLTSCLEAGYSALVDAKNNVFVYEHRNQGNPKKTVLKEYVLALPNGAGHVIGGRIFAKNLPLLTSSTLFAIALPNKLNEDER